METRHKIYLAGKIDPDWRSALVTGYREGADKAWDILHNYAERPYPFPTLRKAIFDTHDYMGAYALANYGDGNSHGLGKHNGGFDHQRLAYRCRRAISEATLFFAYITSDDCYGTLWELGYAHALKKPIYIYNRVDPFGDLWFALAQATLIHEETVEASLQRALAIQEKRDLRKISEGKY